MILANPAFAASQTGHRAGHRRARGRAGATRSARGAAAPGDVAGRSVPGRRRGACSSAGVACDDVAHGARCARGRSSCCGGHVRRRPHGHPDDARGPHRAAVAARPGARRPSSGSARSCPLLLLPCSTTTSRCGSTTRGSWCVGGARRAARCAGASAAGRPGAGSRRAPVPRPRCPARRTERRSGCCHRLPAGRARRCSALGAPSTAEHHRPDVPARADRRAAHRGDLEPALRRLAA